MERVVQQFSRQYGKLPQAEIGKSKKAISKTKERIVSGKVTFP